MRHSISNAKVPVLAALLATACAASTTGGGTSEGPLADGGTTSADGGATNRIPENSLLLSLVPLSYQNATGVVFDGSSWKKHTFPEGTAGGELSATALAPDGTGMAVVAGTQEAPPRFTRFLGGETWTEFANVTAAKNGGYNGIALTFRNGLYVLAYTTEEGLVYQLLEPKGSAWSAPTFLAKGSGMGVVRLGTSARDSDEVFLTVFHTRDRDSVGYGISFKPVFGGPNPGSMDALPSDWQIGGPILSRAMTPLGSNTPVQVSFAYKDDNVLIHFGGEATAAASVPCRPNYDLVVRKETPSQVSLLCTNTKLQYEEVTGALKAGSPPTFTFQRRTVGPAYGNSSMVYLAGLGSDANYLVAVQSAGTPDAQAVLLRGPGFSAEAFAPAGWSASAVVGP